MTLKTHPVKVNTLKSSKPVAGIIYRLTNVPYIILYHWDKSYTVLKFVQLQNGTIGYFQQNYMVTYNVNDKFTSSCGDVPESYPPKEE